MFVNLIDEELQDRIANSEDLDSNAAEVLKLLLEKAPSTMTIGLNDWELKPINSDKIISRYVRANKNKTSANGFLVYQKQRQREEHGANTH